MNRLFGKRGPVKPPGPVAKAPEKPAAGQVWAYQGGLPVMLIVQMEHERGAWSGLTVSQLLGACNILTWYGLHDDPKRRIAGWVRLDD